MIPRLPMALRRALVHIGPDGCVLIWYGLVWLVAMCLLSWLVGPMSSADLIVVGIQIAVGLGSAIVVLWAAELLLTRGW